jgi:hypothetical protein
MKFFANALLNPLAAMPDGLIDPKGRPALRRFDVYRNNVTVGLIRALEAGFPAIKSLVGADFFAAMALEYARSNPPHSRIMMLYGDQFDHFIRGFAPATSLGYLPDIATLEQAIRHSYHSADATPVIPEVLGSLTEEQFLSARLRFAPAVYLQSSPWPIHAIWNAALHGGPSPTMVAQDILILRPSFDPEVHLLPCGAIDFLRALQAGQTVESALETAQHADFDLTAILSVLIAGGAITGVDCDQIY